MLGRTHIPDIGFSPTPIHSDILYTVAYIIIANISPQPQIPNTKEQTVMILYKN